MAPDPGDITRLLQNLRAGDRNAEEQLITLVYDELHRVAERYMRRERADHSWQPTLLVHEAYRVLVGQQIDWQSRAHFYALAARHMRRLLIDHARRQHALKNGGQYRRAAWSQAQLTEALRTSSLDPDVLLALDEALTRLSELSPRQSRIVEMRFFGGLTEEEMADVLGVALRTVKREWERARTWLFGELTK